MSRYDIKNFGIRVTLPNGECEWYDPCDEEPVTSELGITTVSTLGHDYEYTAPINWEKYLICSDCGYEVDDEGWCKVGCLLCEEECV